jgi:TRAP-type C4-dicarboxylate transport system substrate-binding protein
LLQGKNISACSGEIVEMSDKTPFQNAVKPVWDEYGPKYQDMVKRIQKIA